MEEILNSPAVCTYSLNFLQVIELRSLVSGQYSEKLKAQEEVSDVCSGQSVSVSVYPSEVPMIKWNDANKTRERRLSSAMASQMILFPPLSLHNVCSYFDNSRFSDPDSGSLHRYSTTHWLIFEATDAAEEVLIFKWISTYDLH